MTKLLLVIISILILNLSCVCSINNIQSSSNNPVNTNSINRGGGRNNNNDRVPIGSNDRASRYYIIILYNLNY